MSAFSEPPQARRRNGRPWPVVRRQRALQDAHRAAQVLRRDVLGFATKPDYARTSPVRFNPFTKYLLRKVPSRET